MNGTSALSLIATDVKSILNALSDEEIRFNVDLMTRTARVLRLIWNSELQVSETTTNEQEEDSDDNNQEEQ